MNDKDGGLARMEGLSREAAEMLERSLLAAVGSVEAEISRVVRRGESDLERMALKFAETLAKVALEGGIERRSRSGNYAAAAIARAARRGSRFS
jgi:hypothetical protein